MEVEMSHHATTEESKKYRLEDWVLVFGRMYGRADEHRDASSLWLDVIERGSKIAEYVRREEYKKAVDTIPDMFSRVLCFVAKYSINATGSVLQGEGIDLRADGVTDTYLTMWILRKYPFLCSACAQIPCGCPSSRYEMETRHEGDEVAKTEKAFEIGLKKRKKFDTEIHGLAGTVNVEALFHMFNQIYGGVQHDPPVSSICFHFLEEVGEVARLLLSFKNIQILKKSRGNGSYEDSLRHLNNELKEEISDVVSWTMAIINKINFTFRSTYPHYQCVLKQDGANHTDFAFITLSELLLTRFYDKQRGTFVCPHCGLEECSPGCRQDRLIMETNEKMKRKREWMHQVDRYFDTNERRDSPREKVERPATLEDDNKARIKVVDMSKTGIGFLSDTLLPVGAKKIITLDRDNRSERITCSIARGVEADLASTGFPCFHGARIEGRSPLPGTRHCN
jgi:NTP pyrophosphatase (non-canonical NTP hydrolase)